MRTMSKISHFAGRFLRTLAGFMPLLALASLFGSCNSLIYDEEGDCDPHYKVRFTFTRNLLFTDAFATQVKDVTLYVIDDSTGQVVLTRHASGPELQQPGYLMDVEVAPGTYSLLAWCGEGHRSSFRVDEESGVKTDLHCLLTDRIEAPSDHPLVPVGTHASNRIGHLFHGKLDAQVFPDEQGVHVYTIDLTKDTNDVTIVLQHLSGDPVDADDFTFTLTEDNGHMDWDNSLIPEEAPVTYFPFDKVSGVAGTGTGPDADASRPASRAQTQLGAAMASFRVGRMMADRKMNVTVYNKDNEAIILNIPLVDYALMVRRNDKGTHLSNQDYLDHRDSYDMVFFLDEDDRWVKTSIIVNSWRIVMQDSGV